MKSWLLHQSGAESVNRKIFRAAVIVGLLTLVVKLGATLKELVVARAFGRNDALDAFLIALLLPTFVLGLVMGALESSLTPTFISTRQKQGPEAAQRLFSSVMLLSLLLLAAVALLLGLLAPYYLPWLGSGFSVAKLKLTRELLYVLLPFILFSGVSRCASAVLNAGERFALPALTPLLTPLIIVLFILAAARWGALSLALGTALGSLLESTILARSLKRHGLHFSVRWNGLDPNLRAVLRQYAPMLAGAFLMGGTLVADQSMAAMLPSGSVAALSYGNKVISVILTIGATGLATAALPYFSRMVAENDWNGCRHTLKRYSRLVAFTTVPLALALIAFSRPLVRLLYQRGAFTAADTQLVSWVQICYAIQIPFYIWSRLPVRLLSAMHRNDLLMYTSAISLALDIVLNFALMKIWGVGGIALSTSLVYAFLSLFLTIWSIRLLGTKQSSHPSVVSAEMISH
jgi:putative peptidoglycan lipid II flippase